MYYINNEVYDELDDELDKLEDYLETNIKKNNNNSNNSNKYNNYKKNNLNDKILSYIDGYWISNPEFNQVSDIDNMILYINFINKTGSLIIISNNTILSKDEISININEDNIKYNKDLLNNIEFNCTFNKLKDNNSNSNNNSNNNFIWKNLEFNCILSINNGNLKIFNNNTIYADLFKNNEITSYINNI